jgi:LuxR family glucitol operon transcriptional activator
MPPEDAVALVKGAATQKGVELHPDSVERLLRRTGRVPLAIVWSIGLMSLGFEVNSVLRRLDSGQSDICRFCFDGSVDCIRERDAYRMLLTLSMFEASAERTMLGQVAGMGDDEVGRDDALADLLQLSLINREDSRFDLLPLTRTFALDELN